MRIIKQIPAIYISSKYIEPESKLGIFISELKSLINKEKEFIKYISSINFWDFNKVSLWSFEEILNYIDEILSKYSNSINNNDINKNILLPLIKFILLLIKNCYNKEIFSSFDNLQKIYLNCLDIEIKILIIEINFLLSDNKYNLIKLYKLFYRTFNIFIDIKIILLDLIRNNFTIDQSIINILEQIMEKIYRKWSIYLTRRKKRLNEEENKIVKDILPYNIFKEIIFNKKNYKKISDFKKENNIYEEYIYFTQGYITKINLYEKNLDSENNNKYLLKDEIVYIICMNNLFFLINEMIECGEVDDKKNKIILISKFILLGLNLYLKESKKNSEDDNNIILSENYIQNYYKDVLNIMTLSNISLELKSVFLNAGIYFMTTFDGYDNILFQNGLFHLYLNDLTHQNGTEMEILTIEQGYNQEFLNIILNFVFNFIFKEIPQNIFSRILELPKNKIYPYRIDNVVFALKKRKEFDENIIKNIILPRIVYEIDNIEIESNELKYNFKEENKIITINQRNNLIDKLFRVLIKIIKKNTNLNMYGNFEDILIELFKNKIKIENKNFLKNIELIPVIINLIYFFIKLCNAFPSKIPTYINNGIFELIIKYFQNYFPKYDGAIYLVFFLLYTICIHEKGKIYLKNNLEEIKILFENIFEKIKNNDNYFYYNLFVLKDINKFELYSPYNALIHLENINDIIKIIFQNIEKYMQEINIELNNITITKNDSIILDEKLYLIESKRAFIDEFFILFYLKDIELFEKNLKIEIISILKLYLDITLNTISLYCLRSHFVIIKPLIALAEKDPNYVFDKIYNKFNEINNNDNNIILNISEIQKYKIISSLQKIFEEIFNQIYKKTNNCEFINNLDKYIIFFSKFIIKMISSKATISYYMSRIDDRQLIMNSKYYIKILSKNIEPQLKELMEQISYKILYRFFPHTTNPKLLIINENNFMDIKYNPELNKNIIMEILSSSFFYNELLKTENKIYNYLFISVEFFYSLGKIIKPKALINIEQQDLFRIKNNIKLSYILSQMVKYLYEEYELKLYDDINKTIKNILIHLFLFYYINYLLYGKVDKNISSIVFFYFIKFGGVKYIFKISKQLLNFCKKEFTNKKEIPIIQSLIIKNLWNAQIGILLLLIKHSFFSYNSFYTILLLENNLVQKFETINELDTYVKYLLLNDFIDVFFDKNNFNNNINIINDMETYSTELTRTMYILFDNCCRIYGNINIIDIKNEKIILKELINKGYNIFEIIQVIQEGQKNNENIIKQIDEYRKNESNKNINNNLKIINKNLYEIGKISLENDEYFINNINIFFNKNNNSNEDFGINRTKSIIYTKDNYLKLLNNIYDILDKCDLSYNKINDMKKMNIKYRIKSFENNKDLLPYLIKIQEEIKKNRNNNNNITKEEIIKKELKYIKFMNYSILRYKSLTNFYENVDINKYTQFIYDNNLIQNSSDIINDLIENKDNINHILIKQIIYEHFLRIYIFFCFLEYNKKNFLKEKKLFLDSFYTLIKASQNNKNIFLFNQAIIILGLQIIIQFFNYSDKSEEIFEEYLIKKNLFEYLLELKFNFEDANINFYENNFKYFITLEESFKQLIIKIFSEKNIYSNLLESIFKYSFANINPENNEIELNNFIELFSDYITLDNKNIFINSIKNIFNIIIKEENNNNEIYILRLKSQYENDIIKIKEDINNNINININKNNLEENIKEIKYKYSEENKILFNILLNHIYKTTELIKEDIKKKQKYQKFIRNYLFDLNTLLTGLNCILHIYPSFIYLLLEYKKEKINFIKYLIKNTFYTLYFYHYCISWPHYVNHKSELENNTTKERKDILRQYNNNPNSFHSFFESFRNINIIISIIHSITYKRRNMNNIEIILINQVRKIILEEINLILNEINENKNYEFNLMYINDDLLPENLIQFKNCIIILYAMTEYIENSDIFYQYNPFEIAELIFDKKFNIVKNISGILQKMKLDEKNEKFHEIGIKLLGQLFKYIEIKDKNNNAKDKNENINNKEDKNISLDQIIEVMNNNFNNNIYEEEEEIIEEEEEENELNQENILEEEIEDSEEDIEDEDSVEVLNNLENPIDINNINIQIFQNENEEEENDNNSENNIYNINNLENNYNEENILFYEYYTEAINNLNKQKIKLDEFLFYEEFITFPFLVLRTSSKNNLIYFSRQKISIDIFSNLDKGIINKVNNMFLYYYIFPFDIKYKNYLNFIFIGLKDKTTKTYYQELDKILNDFFNMYSVNDSKQIKNNCNDIINIIKEDKNIIKEKKEINDKNVEGDDKNNENIKNKLNDEDIKLKTEADNINNAEFLMELPSDLKEEILLTLDPKVVPYLSQELKNEYNNLINKNNIINDINLFPLFNNNENINLNNNNNTRIIKVYKLQKLNYKFENLFNIYNNKSNNINLIIEEIFLDDILENIILFNLKNILIYKKKDIKNNNNEYDPLLNKLIQNEKLRYKIFDILLNIYICDYSCLFNLLKKGKIQNINNNFLNELYYLIVKLNLNNDFYFLNYYENFIINFVTKNQKNMKKYFLQSFFEENGDFIFEGKIFNITPNSKNVKKLLNIEYNKEENVLNNLINIILVNNNNSSLKNIFSKEILSIIIFNCLKDKEEININEKKIEKIINLFDNFEINLEINKNERTNNPTSLLIEMINDKKIFNIILDVLLKKIKILKDNITQEMDDFLKNKKIDIILFNKILPEILLFKLVKFIYNINESFNDKISDLEKNKDNNNIDLEEKKDMQKKLKHYIKDINNILFSCWEQLNNLLKDINILIKESQDNILPKLNKLIPYLETFITLSHLQYISTYPSILNLEKNPFIFEQNFDSNINNNNKNNIQSLSLIRLNSKNEVDNFVEFFYDFCEKNKKLINYILKQYPKIFTTELIQKISSLLDLENKKKYFNHCLKKLPCEKKTTIEIQVRRNGSQLFNDSFEALYKKDAKVLRGKLVVYFENEEAVDEGGVKREWLTLLSKEMFNPNYMLFSLAKNGTTYTINSDSGKYNSDHLKYFEFIGKIIAKAIFDGMMLDCYFTRIIYKLISGCPLSYHDMEDYDPVYYNSIKWLLETNFTNSETYLTYSYNHDNLGEIQTVDLIENGRNIDVTEENKFDYVQRLCSYKLYDTIKLQINSLLKGFYDIIPKNLISIFNYRELELIISGMPTINLTDWKNNTIYENYNEESTIIKYFWEIIESFDNDERAEFLQFVTGSSKVPLEGFCALQGIGGINKFKISKVFDKNFDRLPTAHTCTNQLDLPEYPSKDILNNRLRLAIKEGKNSFGFV